MRKFLIAVMLMTFLASPVFAAEETDDLAAPDDLDASFGTGGNVSTSLGKGSVVGIRPVGMCVQEDGKSIVVGGAVTAKDRDRYFTLARYNPDGSLDTSFVSAAGNAAEDVPSEPGIVITNFTRSSKAYARRCAVGPKDEIVVVGTSVLDGRKRFAVAKYRPNGSRDKKFSGNGLEEVEFDGKSEAMDVAIAPDGKIWVAGYWKGPGHGRRIAVARFVADSCGVNDCLDSSFGINTGGDGSDGSSVNPPSSTSETAYAIAVGKDGKAVVGGYAVVGNERRFLVARYTAGACLEGDCSDKNHFNMGKGYIISNAGDGFQEKISSIIFQGGGKIAAAGSSFSDSADKFVVRRYNADGLADGSFGAGGVAYIDSDLNIDVYGLARHGGKMIVSGSGCRNDGTKCQTVIVVLNADNGMPDDAFAAGGHIVSSYPKGAVGVMVQSDGKIIAVGPNGETPSGFGLARFMGFYSPSTGGAGQ